MEHFVSLRRAKSHKNDINIKKVRFFSVFLLSNNPFFYILYTRTLCSPPNPQKTGPALLGQFSFCF